jgi:hypothetical protein
MVKDPIVGTRQSIILVRRNLKFIFKNEPEWTFLLRPRRTITLQRKEVIGKTSGKQPFFQNINFIPKGQVRSLDE